MLNRFKITLEKELTLNVSAFRLLYIYQLLCQSEAYSYENLNAQLCEHPLIGRQVTVETLNKYLQTLRVMGCQVTRSDFHGQIVFRLEDHPLNVPISAEELFAIDSVSKLLQQHPVSAAYKSFCNLVKRLGRLPDPESCPASITIGHEILKNPLLPTHLTQKLDTFTAYCNEEQTLEIVYEKSVSEREHLILEPIELLYQKKRLYLIASDPKTGRKARYDIERIVSYRQLPSRSRSQTVKTIVNFKLTGRVATNYRVYPGESVMDKGEFILVKHPTDEMEPLLQRLLKYGPECQIIGPDSARNQMKDMLEKLYIASHQPVDLTPYQYLIQHKQS